LEKEIGIEAPSYGFLNLDFWRALVAMARGREEGDKPGF
jgi:hypothetical protein